MKDHFFFALTARSCLSMVTRVLPPTFDKQVCLGVSRHIFLALYWKYLIITTTIVHYNELSFAVKCRVDESPMWMEKKSKKHLEKGNHRFNPHKIKVRIDKNVETH